MLDWTAGIWYNELIPGNDPTNLEIKLTMQKLKEKFLRFMSGRYGVDQLYYGLFVLYIVLLLLNVLLRWPLFSILMTADLVWMIYRVLSRNYAARRSENEKFLKLWNPVKDGVKLTRNRIRDCRTHVYHTCPHCKAVLRLPRKKGEHTVCCPRCRGSFTMKVYFGGK